MAKKVYKTPRTDPRYLLQKAVKLMAKTLDQLAERAKTTEKRSADGGLISAGGLGSKDIDSLIGLSGALHRLARQADADDVSRVRQLKGMTDEQLAEMERKLKSAEHSEAIKQGLRDKALAEEVELENEHGE